MLLRTERVRVFSGEESRIGHSTAGTETILGGWSEARGPRLSQLLSGTDVLFGLQFISSINWN